MLDYDKVQTTQQNGNSMNNLSTIETKKDKFGFLLTAVKAATHYASPPSISQYLFPVVEIPHLHEAKTVESLVAQSASERQVLPAFFEVKAFPQVPLSGFAQ